MYGPNCYGGESVFVPRHAPRETLAEDDGYLLVHVRDEANQQSYVEIINAQTLDPQPLARVHIPNRVPYGFHAHYVNQNSS